MAIKHRAYLLDYAHFQLEVEPILEALDQGNIHPLFNAAFTVFKQGRLDEWSLTSSGEILLDISNFNKVGHPWETPIEELLNKPESVHPGDFGYWLLIIFSQFLQECTGIDVNFTILDRILEERGWSEGDRRVLLEGNPTYELIKPGHDQVHPQNQDEWRYWHWMRPANVFKEGYLSEDDIVKLYNLLINEEKYIQQLDPKHFGEEWMGWSLDVPEGQMEFLNRLQDAYSNTLTMFSEAIDAKKSLYVTLSYT